MKKPKKNAKKQKAANKRGEKRSARAKATQKDKALRQAKKKEEDAVKQAQFEKYMRDLIGRMPNQ